MLFRCFILSLGLVLLAKAETVYSGTVTTTQVEDWTVHTVSGSVLGSASPCLGIDFAVSAKHKIIGSTTNSHDNVITDLQCLYSAIGTGGRLHFENVKLWTDHIDGYALYTKETLVTMKNVDIEGYSGCRTGQSFENSTCIEKAGGAMRIRNAQYPSSEFDKARQALVNVHVKNCCRGFRIQDSTNAHVHGSTTESVTDNAFYFASGSYSSTTGCVNSSFSSCTATNTGQTGFQNIGGANNEFNDIVVIGSRGAGFSNYNSNAEIRINKAFFNKVNTAHTKTPWNGNTDDYNGAAIGMSVASTDTNGVLIVNNAALIGANVAGGGAIPLNGPPSYVVHNNGHGTVRTKCMIASLEFPGGLRSGDKIMLDGCVNNEACSVSKHFYKRGGCCQA